MKSKLFDNTVVGAAQETVDFITNILESSTEYSIIGKDLHGGIILWNEGARRIYGYDPEEVVGKANSEILHTPEDIATGKPRKMMEDALRDGKWEGTLLRVRKNGSRFTARVVITPRREPTGRPIGFLLMSKDITKEVRLEEELKKSKLFDRTLVGTPQEAVDFITNILESSTEYSIIGKDLQGTIVLWNEGARRSYGYDPEEVVGKENSDILHTALDIAAGKPRKMLDEALKNGKWEGTLVRVRKNGSQFTARVVITPRRDYTGRPIGFLLMSKDITEEVRLEEELKKSKLFDRTVVGTPQEAVDFITNILESSTEYSIIGKDLQGTIVLWNEGARRSYGYDPEEVVGKANSEILHTPEDIAAGKPRKILGEALRDGKWEGTLVRVRQNGSRFTARVVITPRRDYTGRPIGFLLISKDITEEIFLTEELRRSRDELEKRVAERTADVALANKYLQQEIEQRKRAEYKLEEKNIELENARWAKYRFLSTISNELRTALNVITDSTDALLTGRTEDLSDETKGRLQAIRSSAKHLLYLITYLLDLAKVEYGKVEIGTEPVDVAGVIREVAGVMRPVAEQKGLKFTDNVPGGPVIVRTHPRALNQILLNLTSNAIKFTENGEIRLELARPYRDGGFLTEISVTDTGIGIREEDQKKIFDPFRQSAASPSRPREGAGLGLHLSQKLAELIGGEISCKSIYGKGSTFTLTLK